MNKIIIILLLIIIGLLTFLVYNSTIQSKSFLQDNSQKDELKIEASSSLHRVIGYRIVLPVKSETKGYLILKTKDTSDTTRINTTKASAISAILKEKQVFYSFNTECLVFNMDSINK